MRYRRLYPISLNMEGERAIVVGGGEVAVRKVKDLMKAGAEVLVISPRVLSELGEMERRGEIRVMRRRYAGGDLKGFRLVIAATSDRETNRRVSRDARALRIPVNVVDRPELCDFFVPSTVRRGVLTIAVSTGGASPALSRVLRERLEKIIDERFEGLVGLLGAWRGRVKGLSEKGEGDPFLVRLRGVVDGLLSSPEDIPEREVERILFQGGASPEDTR